MFIRVWCWLNRLLAHRPHLHWIVQIWELWGDALQRRVVLDSHFWLRIVALACVRAPERRLKCITAPKIHWVLTIPDFSWWLHPKSFWLGCGARYCRLIFHTFVINVNQVCTSTFEPCTPVMVCHARLRPSFIDWSPLLNPFCAKTSKLGRFFLLWKPVFFIRNLIWWRQFWRWLLFTVFGVKGRLPPSRLFQSNSLLLVMGVAEWLLGLCGRTHNSWLTVVQV